MRLNGIRIQNIGPLHDLSFGSFIGEPFRQLTVLTGRNGSGKTSFCLSMQYLTSALAQGVEKALEVFNQFDLEKVKTRGEKAPVQIHVHLFEEGTGLFDYSVAIDYDAQKRPYVITEKLTLSTDRHQIPLLKLKGGTGKVWFVRGGSDLEINEQKEVDLESKALGLGVFGMMQQYPLHAKCLRYFQNWYFININPAAIRTLPGATPTPHLNRNGSNLTNVVKFIETEHPERINHIQQLLKHIVVGIEGFETITTADQRLLLGIYNSNCKSPFFPNQTSDGILKILACLVALENKDTPSLICIEHIEQQLDGVSQKLLIESFLAFMKQYSDCQLLLTTHSEHLLDLVPDQARSVLSTD